MVLLVCTFNMWILAGMCVTFQAYTAFKELFLMLNLCGTFDRDFSLTQILSFLWTASSFFFLVSFLPVISSAIFIPPCSSVGGLMNGKKILETGEGFKLEAAILNTILYKQEAKF